MKVFSKIVMLIGALQSSFLLAKVEDCTLQLKSLLESNQLKSQDLYKYITTVGMEVFGGQKNLKDRGITNLLTTNPALENLTSERFKPWKSLVGCTSWWYNSSMAERLDIDHQVIEKYANGELYIEQISDEMVEFSKNLPKNNISDSIQNLRDIYLTSLKQLPQISFQKRSPDEVVESYKKLTTVNFIPKLFFDAYKKMKEGYKKDRKEIADQDIYYFLQAIPSSPFQFSQDLITKMPDLNQRRNMAATIFVNMLEELIDQSQKYKGSFWSRAPKNLLTKEQQGLAQEIIDYLYILFPGMETTSIVAKIAGSNAEINKTAIVLFAESRVLLIVLRAYLRKAGIPQKK